MVCARNTSSVEGRGVRLQQSSRVHLTCRRKFAILVSSVCAKNVECFQRARIETDAPFPVLPLVTNHRPDRRSATKRSWRPCWTFTPCTGASGPSTKTKHTGTRCGAAPTPRSEGRGVYQTASYRRRLFRRLLRDAGAVAETSTKTRTYMRRMFVATLTVHERRFGSVLVLLHMHGVAQVWRENLRLRLNLADPSPPASDNSRGTL